MSDIYNAPAPPENAPSMTAEELAVIALGTPTPADPASGTPTPQPESISTDESATPPPDGSSSESTPAPPEAKNAVGRRIDQLVAEKHAARAAAQEAERRAALAEATLAELRQLAQTPPDGTPPDDTTPRERTYTQADLQREAGRAAAEIEFNKACNAAVTKGRADFPEAFDKSLDSLRSVTPVLPKMFVEAALETGAAPAVLHALGQNLAEYDRIISLPPLRQAVELTKLASTLTKAPEATPVVPKPKPVPAPISPRVGGGNGTARSDISPDDPKSDEIPSAEWFKRREAQIEAARKANGGRRR